MSPTSATPPADGRTTLALVMNTRNEAARLQDAIASAPGVDEIVVADMESTDDTVAIAEANGARTLSLPVSGYCETGRQAAIDAATSEWVLILDGDERLAPGGVDRIRELIARTAPEVSAYWVPFDIFLGPTRIHATGWGLPDEYHLRLFRRADCDWPAVVHAVPRFRGELVMLPEDDPIRIRHDNFDDLRHAIDKFNRYTSTEAADVVAAIADGGREPSIGSAVRRGIDEFVRRYSPDEDGSLSFAMSLLMFGYRADVDLKAIEATGWNARAPQRSSVVDAWQAFWDTLARGERAAARRRAEDAAGAGDLAAAADEVTAALTEWGDDAGLYSDLAAIAHAAGDGDAARRAIARAVALDPTDPDVAHNARMLGGGSA